MGRSQQTFRKKELADKRLKKRKDKNQKKLERKEKGTTALDDMIAYVDENGMISSTPPDPNVKKKETKASDIEIGVPSRDDVKEDPVKTGVLVFFNDSKGYGFIKDSESQEKYFVHINNMIDDIRENDKVSFELERGQKGMTAVKVKLAK